MNGRQTLERVLDKTVWGTVNRQLLRKILSEFMYEELIDPERGETVHGWTEYRLPLENGIEYRFHAQERVFDSYRIDPTSIEQRGVDGEWKRPECAVQFLVDARNHIGIEEGTLSHLVCEYNNTLLADAHIYRQNIGQEADTPEHVIDMEYAEIEGEMEGHPWFTYNKGRVGFSYGEYLQYAPERKEPQTLSWIAARRDRATYSAVDGLGYESLLRTELGEQYDVFVDQLRGNGFDPENYYVFPVHEWQWDHSIVQFFAGDIAENAIIPLGDGPDEYLPQQSIRTLMNITSPEKHHVKLPLRILNTNVYRGLLGEQAETAPLVTEFVKTIRDQDRFLREECDLLLPGEVASMNYEHPTFSRIEGAPYQFHELLGCIWRESCVELLDRNERPVTLAALMHEDTDGTVLSSFVERSGLSLASWLDELFEALLFPLLHYLYRYGTVFMPHGTNVVLVLEDAVPQRIAIEDFVDEVAITDRDFPELRGVLSDELRSDERFKHHILHQLPPEDLCQHIFGTLFICVLRYVSDLLQTRHAFPEERFWKQVRTIIEGYHSRFPQLETRFETFDLFKPEFTKLCLNRNRILDYGYDDYTTRPKVTGHGTVSNALSSVGSER